MAEIGTEEQWKKFNDFIDQLKPGDIVSTKNKIYYEYIGVQGDFIFKKCFTNESRVIVMDAHDLFGWIDTNTPTSGKVFVCVEGQPIEANTNIVKMMMFMLKFRNRPTFTKFEKSSIKEFGTHYQIGCIGNEKDGHFHVYSDTPFNEITENNINWMLNNI
jgi:hypothetical protein